MTCSHVFLTLSHFFTLDPLFRIVSLRSPRPPGSVLRRFEEVGGSLRELEEVKKVGGSSRKLDKV